MPGTVSSAASRLVALHAGWLAGWPASRPERLRGCATSFPGAGRARPRLKLRAWRSCLSSRGRPSEESGAGPAEASASWAGMRAPECINIPWLTLQLVYCNSNYTQTHTHAQAHTTSISPPSFALPSPFARRVRLGGGGERRERARVQLDGSAASPPSARRPRSLVRQGPPAPGSHPSIGGTQAALWRRKGTANRGWRCVCVWGDFFTRIFKGISGEFGEGSGFASVVPPLPVGP